MTRRWPRGDVANCGITQYDFDDTLGPCGARALTRYDFTVPLEREGTPVIAEPGVQKAAR